MEKALKYVSQLDPGFCGNIRSATSQQIAHLESLTNVTIPQCYRDFLAVMGMDTGGLALAAEGTTKITEIIEYYETEVVPGERDLPDQCILFGVGAISIPDLAVNSRDGDTPEVVFTDGDEVTGLYAETLEKLVCAKAFSKYRCSDCLYKASLSASYAELKGEVAIEAVRVAALECGLQTYWFSDRITCCAEMIDAAVYDVQYDGEGIGIRVAGRLQDEVFRIATAVSKSTGIRRIDWR